MPSASDTELFPNHNSRVGGAAAGVPAVPEDRRGGESTVAAVVRFALPGLAALVIVAVAGALVFDRISTDEAIEDARTLTRVLGKSVIEPNLTDELVAGDRDAIAEMDRIVRAHVAGDTVFRVKLWTADGRVVYSNQPRLIGVSFRLEKEQADVLRRGGVVAKRESDFSDSENIFERGVGDLLEVYLPVHTPGGRPLLFETYQRYSSVESVGRRSLWDLSPALLVALAVLWLIQVPLAGRMARRLQAGRRDREALLQEALSARRVAEERLQAARVIDKIADGVLLLDREGATRLWNPAAEAITGLSAASVVGRPVDDAIPGWPRVDQLAADGPSPGAGRQKTVPVEVAGRELWLSVSGVSFSHGTVYAFHDITGERQMEKLRSEIVSTMSHELRTPVASVYGAASTLQRRDIDLDEALRDKLLGIIHGEAGRLARIIDDILWANRLDTDSINVTPEAVDAAGLLRSVIEGTNARLELPRRIELLAPPEAPLVKADADMLRQVLVNLVENAIKYSPADSAVEITLEPEGRSLRFAVRDEGLGIPQHEQDRIFDKFYRLDPDMNRGVGGSGLGLYICRELIRRMNGRIWVVSKQGEGSTFLFELALAETGSPVAAAALTEA